MNSGSTTEDEVPILPSRARPVFDGSVCDWPHLLRVLLQLALRAPARKPICVVLPDVEDVVPLVATLASLEFHSDSDPKIEHLVARLALGGRVRVLPDGYVFTVGERVAAHGMSGLWVHYTGPASKKRSSKLFVPLAKLGAYEQTVRMHPLSLPEHKPTPLKPNSIDHITGRTVWGNTSLIENRVVLIGARAQFEEFLNRTGFQLVGEDAVDVRAFAEEFPWGATAPEGRSSIQNPAGSGGDPLVAIARDIDDANAFLRGSALRAPSLVVTDRLTHVLKNLDAISRLADRNQVIVFAPASRRDDVATLTGLGWNIWELTPREILGSAADETVVRHAGLRSSMSSASAEVTGPPQFVECQDASLGDAFAALSALGGLLQDDAFDDPATQMVLDRAQSLYYACAGMVRAPNANVRNDLSAASRQLAGPDLKYVTRFGGTDAIATLRQFASSTDAFLAGVPDGALTPKGTALLRQVQLLAGQQPVVVVGHSTDRDAIDGILRDENCDAICNVSRTVRPVSSRAALLVSIVNGKRFIEAVDPWPARSTVFLGYPHELAVYRARLSRRERQRRQLGLTADERLALTGLDERNFPAEPSPTAQVDEKELHEQLTRQLRLFDRVADSAVRGHTAAHRPPPTRPGDTTCDARVIKFVGRSWMAMTEEHRSVALMPARSETSRARVETLSVSSLRTGMRLVVREGGDRDVIRALAELAVGKQAYERLRRSAALWKTALLEARARPDEVASKLGLLGIRPNLGTIRGWLYDDDRIAPRDDDVLAAIASTFPVPGKNAADWDKCRAAIRDVRGMHLRAGMVLTDHLSKACGRLLLDPADHEIAVELRVGTVWVLEVESIADALVPCAVQFANRLNWTDAAWKESLIERAVLAEGAGS